MDSTTIGLVYERLFKTGRDRVIWNELQRQIDSKGIKVKRGSAHDTSFITADPGHSEHEEPREEGKSCRSKDGSFNKKNDRAFVDEFD